MTAASTSFVHAGSCRLRVQRSGTGPLLVLINGIGAPLEMWQPLLRELRGFETVAFDMPGCGLSPTPRRPRSMRQLAEIVDDLLRVLGRRRAHVLGYSHGGLVAQELARRRPDRVDRLILAATTPGMPAIPPNLLIAALMLTPARYYNRKAAEAIVPLIAGGRSRRDPEALRTNIDLRMSHPPSWRGYTQQLAATATWSSHRWLRCIRHETLVLHGDDDPLVPMRNARYLARAIPNASLQVVPDAGHLVLLDEPALAARHITAFLTGAAAVPGAAAGRRAA